MMLPPDKKALGLWLLAAALAGLAWMLPRIPQPLQYHDFADRRACFGVANCFDTASNALFVLAGLAGLHFLFSKTARYAFIDPREALPYRLFFFAAILLGIIIFAIQTRRHVGKEPSPYLPGREPRSKSDVDSDDTYSEHDTTTGVADPESVAAVADRH